MEVRFVLSAVIESLKMMMAKETSSVMANQELFGINIHLYLFSYISIIETVELKNRESETKFYLCNFIHNT